MNLKGNGPELRDMVGSAADAADALSNERTYVTRLTLQTVAKGLTVSQFQTLLRKTKEALACFKDDQVFQVQAEVGKEEVPAQQVWDEKVQEAFDAKEKAAQLLVPDKKIVGASDAIEELQKRSRKRASTKV